LNESIFVNIVNLTISQSVELHEDRGFYRVCQPIAAYSYYTLCNDRCDSPAGRSRRHLIWRL